MQMIAPVHIFKLVQVIAKFVHVFRAAPGVEIRHAPVHQCSKNVSFQRIPCVRQNPGLHAAVRQGQKIVNYRVPNPSQKRPKQHLRIFSRTVHQRAHDQRE